MGSKLFVFDDDPTGTQSVHGVPVRTRWNSESLARELEDPAPACFLLANSRALPEADAAELARETGRALKAAMDATGRAAAVVSRSDSTLRGHYPAEVDALAEGLGIPEATILLCPFFAAGGRVTLDGVHCLMQDGRAVPVGETEFARDATFGYRASRLDDWVVEKTAGRIRREQVGRIDVATIALGPDAIADRLVEMAGGFRVVTIDAAKREHVAAVAEGARRAEGRGATLLARTAADYAAARAGIEPIPPLDAQALGLREGPVLTVVGSYVDRTTRQLERLQALPDLEIVEVDVEALIGPDGEIEAGRCRDIAGARLASGRDTVLATSRTRHHAGDLAVGAAVAARIAAIVRDLVDRVAPRCLVAKGGVTSSVLAVDALGVERAWVEGPALPGVPVWRLGPESRAPGMPLVVFPGNVGDDDALAEVVRRYRCRNRD